MNLSIHRGLLALLLLSMAQLGRTQSAPPCCEVRPSASSTPVEPVSTPRGPSSAPITILAFSDFESFPCARSATVLATLLAQSNDVRLIFKHAPAATNPNALLAHEAALAAGAQGKFWEMHDTLFANQTKLTRADLLTYAKQLNLNLPAFQQALDNHTYRPIIERDLAEAKGLGVTTAPTFFVNGRRLVGPQGYASLGAVIETLLAGIPPSQRAPQDIAASGPAQAIDLERAPTKGPPTAPVSLVEFSDFECPYCAQAAPIVQQLAAAYPTQVRVAFKHYPLPMHKESPLAHEASLAAAEQGKFWEMHDLLFATQAKLTREDLLAKARQLNLDTLRFARDLDTHRFQPAVEADRQEGNRLGVDGTPFFFINGHAISGGASLADFKKLIESALKEAKEAAAPLARPVPGK
jgi:protein-disulfide isomerase